MDTARRLRDISNCTARLAALHGENALALKADQRAEIHALTLQIEQLTRAVLSKANLDGTQMGFAPVIPAKEIPGWSSDLRHMDGSRVTAMEHFERYWKSSIAAGHLSGGDIRRKNPRLYKALAEYQARRGKALSDLLISPHREHVRQAGRVAHKGRHRLSKATRG